MMKISDGFMWLNVGFYFRYFVNTLLMELNTRGLNFRHIHRIVSSHLSHISNKRAMMALYRSTGCYVKSLYI